MIVDTEYNLYQIDPRTSDYVYGGTWSYADGGIDAEGNISGVIVKLACDFDSGGTTYARYETVAFEELLQIMGAGYDQIEYPYHTIHTEFNYYNKQSSMYPKDADILRLLYSPDIKTGDTYYAVCRKLNIPKGVYQPSASEEDSAQTVKAVKFLDRGGRYNIRAFIVNSNGQVSGTSDWLTIDVPEINVEPWNWNAANYPDKAEGASKAQTNRFYQVLTEAALPENGFSYRVWNDLVDKVAEVIEAYGNSWYAYSGYGKEGCKVNSGDTFSAAKYNEVRYQIGSILSTGITDRVAGDEILGSYITVLTDNINTIISTML